MDAAIPYAVFWASLPVTLLNVGIGHLRYAVPGWRWPAAWAGAVAAGIALDPLCLLASDSYDTRNWWWAAPSMAFVAIGAVMIGVFIGAMRSRARED